MISINNPLMDQNINEPIALMVQTTLMDFRTKYTIMLENNTINEVNGNDGRKKTLRLR